VDAAVGGRRLFRALPDARVRFPHHLFAEVDSDEVLLIDVVVEHVLGGLAEIDDPLAERGRSHTERHVLGVIRAHHVVVAADTANARCDEVGVARVFALHED
jgi:hypothetical protein